MVIDLSYMRVVYSVLIFIFVFCGLLRGLDFWKALGKDADELYPARRIVSCVYFSAILLLPCALRPQSSGAQLLSRCFWILFVPAATALCYKRFFYGDGLYRRLRVALVGGVPLAFTLALSCIAMAGGDMLMPYRKAVIHAAVILGALLSAYEIHVMIWLWHVVSGADVASRAADGLFPKRFASGMLLVSSSVLVVTWAVFLFGGVLADTVFAIIIAFVGLGILFVILHPQRVEENAVSGGQDVQVAVTTGGSAEQVAAPDGEQSDENAVTYVKAYSNTVPTKMRNGEKTGVEVDKNLKGKEPYIIDGEKDGDILLESAQPKKKKYMLSDTQLDSMERQIRKFVEGKRQYLDPKLTRKTLEEELCVNHFYLSEVFARRFGSLTLYLNTLRMEHAIRYAAEHPDAKQTEVVHCSGFGSDNSYYRAKRIYEAEKTSEAEKTDSKLDNSDL